MHQDKIYFKNYFESFRSLEPVVAESGKNNFANFVTEKIFPERKST